MAWSAETWAAVTGAMAAIASLAVMLTQRAVDAHRAKTLQDAVSLLKSAAAGYRDEVRGLRNEIVALQTQIGAFHRTKADVSAQRERRLNADRKWKAAMDVVDRLNL